MELKLLSGLPPSSVGGAMKPAVLSKTAGSGSAGAHFSAALSQALSAVSQAQDHATVLQREVQLENPKVSLEETMVAIQKAQIGFQATIHVRNRMVQAYTDIMNMQV